MGFLQFILNIEVHKKFINSELAILDLKSAIELFKYKTLNQQI